MAVVVIDHPLHGERGFALTGSMDSVTTSDDPTPYLNLSYLTVARDNLKQSVADLLGLRLAVGLANAKGAIGTAGSLKVHFLGHSLGAIAGANLLAVANQSCWQSPGRCPVQVRHRRPGHAGGRHRAAAAELADLRPDHPDERAHRWQCRPEDGLHRLCPELQDGGADLLRQRVPAEPGCNHPRRTAAGTLQSYSFAAQSVLDSADPINLGSGIAADFPLFATEVVGDGALSLSDRVIPNSIATAPWVAPSRCSRSWPCNR